MAAVKRRINSTGRRRIGHDRVTVTMLSPGPGAPPAARAELRIDDLGFPETAGVVLEAYQRSAAMRFPCGSFAAPEIPGQLDLLDLDPAAPVLFRLKVVDRDEQPGRLLGAADRIRPDGGDAPDRRRSLFPIERKELHSEVWKVHIDEAGPVLLLNYNIPGLTARIQKDPLVNGLLLPAALRVVLDRLSREPAEDDETEVWKTQWFRFLRDDLSYADEVPEPGDSDEERESWVDGAVRAFGKENGFVGRNKASMGGEHEAVAQA
jgi:hypothetical protein